MARTSTIVVTSTTWVQLPATDEGTLYNNHPSLGIYLAVSDDGSITANSEFVTVPSIRIPPESERSFSGLVATDVVWLRLRDNVPDSKVVNVTLLST